MDVQDFLGEGEKVVETDGNVHLTDRKVLILERRSYTAIPYEQISSIEYERSILWGIVALGVAFVGIGALADLSSTRLAGAGPTTEFLIFTIVGVLCYAIGFLLPLASFIVRTTSGKYYRLRTRNSKFLSELVRLSGRALQREPIPN